MIQGNAESPIGVIGGSGFYEFIDDATAVDVETPYGPPSERVLTGLVGGRRVAFMPRHGRDHRFAPHRVPYRANLWALRSVGVRQLLAPCAVGSLRPDLGPGALVIPDQVVDRTVSREATYYDAVGPVVHVSFGDPYCPVGRRAVVNAAGDQGWPAADGGTLVVIQGPRFSSRAESQHHAAAGWSIVGMTGQPEATLARELALCYTSIAVVTDLDAGVEAGEGVTHHEVLEVFAESIGRLRTLLAEVIVALPHERECACGHALDGQPMPFELPS
ncbi:MAG: S-methyl-5'-thioadenosine phosphorylase [Acidothermaceae bacterium]